MALPSVLLITFTLHLLLHILNHLIPDQLDAFLWQLFLRLPIPPAAQTATQTHNTPRLKQEIVRLQRDLSATSAQDDFARWARLRRELDRAKAKLDENCTFFPFHALQSIPLPQTCPFPPFAPKTLN